MANIQTPATSSSLLKAVRNRDSDAWRRLTEIYGPTVYNWSRRAGLQPADAADIVQQVFATVATQIDKYQGHRVGDSFGGWLWTLFHSRLIDHFRDYRKQPLAVGDSEVKRLHDAAPEEPPPTSSGLVGQESDAVSEVRRALTIIEADFSATTWRAFWQSTIEGLATSEVARELEITPAAVCMARSRVLRRLRETLDGLGIYDV